MEGKTIWLSPGTKEQLDKIRDKGETFNAVVERLLKLYVMMSEASKTLGPSHYLKDVEKYFQNVELIRERK